jgi:hypothetical protein
MNRRRNRKEAHEEPFSFVTIPDNGSSAVPTTTATNWLPVSMTPAMPVSLTPAKTYIGGVVQTGDKLVAGVFHIVSFLYD